MSEQFDKPFFRTEIPADFAEAEMQADETAVLAGLNDFGESRRQFLGQVSAAGLSVFAAQLLMEQEILANTNTPDAAVFAVESAAENAVSVRLKINGAAQSLNLDSRVTLLDALREKLELTGTKKGCDHGQCGACTVIVNGRRVLSCLTLAAACEGSDVKTIEGIADGDNLHALQTAFIKHDAFQCGYCTPGQICSAVALLEEAKRGDVSYVSTNLQTKARNIELSDEEIRERMSGNLCRCGAYPHIVAAIREVQSGRETAQNWAFVGKEKNDETV